jgi:hypothetical protein
MRFSIVRDEQAGSVAVFDNGDVYTAPHTHHNFDEIVRRLTSGETEGVLDLFDPEKTITTKFERLSDQVLVRNGRVYFDGDEVDSSLTDQILRFLEEGSDFTPLVAFFENVSANPEPHSREQLYDWLRNHEISITDEGTILAYKGVHSTEEEGKYRSGFQGKAIVDGEEVEGYIPNFVGAVVEMPRSQVVHDPSTACSRGLHVGTYNYAQSYARGAMLAVEVNPRDVVSVPTDGHGAKVRVCRYKVREVIEQPYSSAYVSSHAPVDEWGDGEDWDDEEDYEYDDPY